MGQRTHGRGQIKAVYAMETIMKGTTAALPELASDTLQRSAALGPIQSDFRGLVIIGVVGLLSLLIAHLISNDFDSKEVGS